MTRFLPEIIGLTPSMYEDFARCPRLFFNGSVLGVPASDPAPSADQGLLVHDMLHRIHTTGSCHDDTHVADVLDAHGAGAPHVRDLISRHRARCPKGADRDVHEHEFARFHRQPAPMFMATARIDAVWVHDGVLDARDYKTGGRFADRVADIPAARVQAYVLAAKASARGLRLQLRYEYLQAEIAEDPETWELDDDDFGALEEELRGTVTRMWEDASDGSWTGVADPSLCGTCRYRSICRDSASPGEPAWPVLASSPED